MDKETQWVEGYYSARPPASQLVEKVREKHARGEIVEEGEDSGREEPGARPRSDPQLLERAVSDGRSAAGAAEASGSSRHSAKSPASKAKRAEPEDRHAKRGRKTSGERTHAASEASGQAGRTMRSEIQWDSMRPSEVSEAGASESSSSALPRYGTPEYYALPREERRKVNRATHLERARSSVPSEDWTSHEVHALRSELAFLTGIPIRDLSKNQHQLRAYLSQEVVRTKFYRTSTGLMATAGVTFDTAIRHFKDENGEEQIEVKQ